MAEPVPCPVAEPAEARASSGTRLKVSEGDQGNGSGEPLTVNRQTGNIHLLYCINYFRCFSMRSNDDDITWSKPVDITATFEPFRMKVDWNVIATQAKESTFVLKIFKLFLSA